MKNTAAILLALFFLTAFTKDSMAKEDDPAPQQDVFAGTWNYKNNNEVFIVALWQTADGYKGHYKKIIVDSAGNQVSVIYDSNKEIGNTGYNWPFTLSSADPGQSGGIGGTIIDNTVTNAPSGGKFIEGRFTMQILNPDCLLPANNCTLMAQWIVKKDPGLRHPNEPDFNIPTSIVLKKQ